MPVGVSEHMQLAETLSTCKLLRANYALQVIQKAFRPSHVQLLQSALRHHRAPIRPCTLVISSYAAEVSLAPYGLDEGVFSCYTLSTAVLFNMLCPLQAPMSTQSRPVYANFSVYKGKAALSLRVGPINLAESHQSCRLMEYSSRPTLM